MPCGFLELQLLVELDSELPSHPACVWARETCRTG